MRLRYQTAVSQDATAAARSRTGGARPGCPIRATVLGLVLFLSLPTVSAELTRHGRLLYWEGKPIQLVGYSYYGLLGDRQFDGEAFMENIAAHNVNLTRFFLILPWPVEPGPNVLPFAKTGDRYDLRQFNDQCFVRLRSLVKKAESLGIVCQVCLFDRCGLSIDDSSAWTNNPYNADCNINGFLRGPASGYPPFCHSDGPIAEVNAALIKKVAETIGDCGNVMYEIINEPVPQLGPLPEWHAWAAGELRKNLAGRTGGKVICSTGAYDDDQIDVFSMHRAGSEDHVAAALEQSKALNKPVIFSDDGDMDCMFNPDVTRASAERALRLGQHFEHLEYTTTLQRELEKRQAARLDQMPALAQINLRTLAERSAPLLRRPYVSLGRITQIDGSPVYRADVKHADQLRRVYGQQSADGGRTWLELPVMADGATVTTGALVVRPGTRSLVRVVCADSQGRLWPGPAGAYGPADTWMITLGEEIVEAGLLRIRACQPDGTLRQVRRGGRTCYETDLAGRGKFAYFRLEDWFPRGNVLGPVTIVVEFLDEPAGSKLWLQYDGRTDSYAAASPVPLEGSGAWKSASFEIRDALFMGRQNDGADLRLSLAEPVAPLALRSIRVQYSPTTGLLSSASEQ